MNTLFIQPTIGSIIQKHIESPTKIVYLGFVRNDFAFMKLNIILLLVSTMLLFSMFASTQDAMEMTLVITSFVMLFVLSLMTIMFHHATDIPSRHILFQRLHTIGYSHKQLREIMTKEIVVFYTSLMLVIFVYVLDILIAMYMHQEIALNNIINFVFASQIPICIVACINRIVYGTLVRKAMQ